MTIADLPADALAAHGLRAGGRVLRNPSTSQLYAAALDSGEGVLADSGGLVVDTGRFTGRSPKDKFIVREPGSEDRIWWGDVNAEISEENFDGLRGKIAASLEQSDVYVIDAFCGADPKHRLSVRVLTAHPYHALFAKTMFIEPTDAELDGFEPDVLILHEPEVEADPATDGTRTEVFVCLHPSRGEVIIGGTFYGGEIKKSVFTVMNDRLPLEGIAPMHCSANVSEDGEDVAIFFGLSGTGKTTLSADPSRKLIGDDEHGWGDDGVFNFEGGCYAKTIRLSADAEPEIWNAVHSFGTVLENVVVDERGNLDLDDDSKTENTRAAYKLEQIANMLPAKRAGHPSNVIFLDGRRVRDPAADRAPQPRAGALLLPLRLHGEARRAPRSASPSRSRRSRRASARRSCRSRRPSTPSCSGRSSTSTARRSGSSTPAGRAGRSARATGCRSRRRARCSPPFCPGHLHEVEFRTDPVFGFDVPVTAPDVDESLLDPRSTWADPARYDEKARELAAMFAENFATKHADAPAEVAAVAPKL